MSGYNENYGIFRGKAKRGDWIEGSLVKRYNGYLGIDRPHTTLEFELVEVIPETVGMSVGKPDKNGKDIFDGDIVSINRGVQKVIAVVRYGFHGQDKTHLGFYLQWVDPDNEAQYRQDIGYWLKYIEVIGNVFDNPELYKGEKL